mmetsp:Transcript_21563/g.66272  ORF Transcript_21563/g.66272 Transcript_21563/m.66272 type:complete len:272 (+) Transcript_21563:1030-1845(+)
MWRRRRFGRRGSECRKGARLQNCIISERTGAARRRRRAVTHRRAGSAGVARRSRRRRRCESLRRGAQRFYGERRVAGVPRGFRTVFARRVGVRAQGRHRRCVGSSKCSRRGGDVVRRRGAVLRHVNGCQSGGARRRRRARFIDCESRRRFYKGRRGARTTLKMRRGLGKSGFRRRRGARRFIGRCADAAAPRDHARVTVETRAGRHVHRPGGGLRRPRRRCRKDGAPPGPSSPFVASIKRVRDGARDARGPRRGLRPARRRYWRRRVCDYM